MGLSGTWQGEFKYGPEYGAYDGKCVRFRMGISQSLVGRITGVVREDPLHGGVPDVGAIVGMRIGPFIRYVKSMPNRYVLVDNEPMLYRVYMKREYGVVISGDDRGHRILYSGRLRAGGDRIVGGWKVLPAKVVANNVLVETGSSSGTWQAMKECAVW